MRDDKLRVVGGIALDVDDVHIQRARSPVAHAHPLGGLFKLLPAAQQFLRGLLDIHDEHRVEEFVLVRHAPRRGGVDGRGGDDLVGELVEYRAQKLHAVIHIGADRQHRTH